MSNPSPSPPPSGSSHQERDEQNTANQTEQRNRRPWAIAIGVTTIALGIVGFVGVRFLIEQKLPDLVANQLSKIINREVEVGEVESISLSGITFGSSAIPPTPTDPDYVTIEAIEVDFNLLPLLTERLLPLEIKLVEPNLYVQQDRTGEWLDLDLETGEGGERPFDLYVELYLEDAEIVAQSYGEDVPITAYIDGSGIYEEVGEDKEIAYNVDAAIRGGNLSFKGETQIGTGRTEAQANIQDLALPPLVSLLPPDIPVELNSGQLNATIKLQVPAFEEWRASRVQGTANLQNISADLEQLVKPITGNARLRFDGTEAIVESARASLGEIVTNVDGVVSWQTGYDLTVDVKPFEVTRLIENIREVSLPVEASGKLQLDLQVGGAFLDPRVTGTISNVGRVRLDEVAFERVNTSFAVELSQFTLNRLQVVPVAGGQITARGFLLTQLREALEEGGEIDFTKMPLGLSFSARLPVEEITAPYYRFPATVDIGTATATGRIQGTIDTPRGFVQWRLPQASTPTIGDVSGTGEILLTGNNIFLRDTQLQTGGGGEIAIAGGINLKSEQWQAALKATDVRLNPFLSEAQLEQIQIPDRVVLQTANARLSGRIDELGLEKLQGIANVAVAVEEGSVSVNTQLENGTLVATASATDIPINRFLPQVSEPISLVNSQIDLSGPLEQILTLRENPNLSRWEATARAQLAVAEGMVAAAALLDDSQWQAEVIASDIDTSQFRQQLALANNIEQLNLPELDVRIDLSGELNPLLRPDLATTIQANRIAIELGEQFLAATGSLLVTDLVTNPEIARIDLDIQARSNFNTLPLNPLLDRFTKSEEAPSSHGGVSLTANQPYIPQEVNVSGQASFKGRLQGENLLSAPLAPGNLELTGNLRLLDFGLNQLEFAPVLAGSVTVAPGQELTLNLRGQEDVIAASLEPCTRGQQCLAPYLPTSFEFRVTQQGTQDPIIATGRRIGDRLVASIEQFPLGVLNLTPADQFAVPGEVQGELSANLDVNLFTLASSGNVQVLEPSLGNIEGEEITASFDYRNNVIQLASASLEFGESDYDLSGRLNLNTGAIAARVDADGNVQDILTALNISSIESVTRFLQPPDYATAAQIQPRSVGQPDASLAYQLNLLYRIEQMLRQLADERLSPGLPTQLDIQGPYSAEVLVAGTLQSPEVNFELVGNNWQWQTQPAVPNLVEPLGLVLEDPQVVPINQVRVQGSYDDGTITLEPLWVRSGEAIVAFSGNLSTQQASDGSFLLQNLPLDFIRNFVEIPLDVAGEINAQGEVEGILPYPEVQGEIAFTEAAINGQALALDPTEAQFVYEDTRLRVNTTAPESIQLQASIPLPTEPGANEQFALDVTLDTEAIALLGPLTEGRIEWVNGEALIELEARGRLSLGGQQPLANLAATGQIVLQDATLGIQSLPEEQITVNGQIALNDQVLVVQQLQGTYAQSQLLVTGTLPLFTPIQYDADTEPLIVVVDQGEIELEDLYVGGIDAEVVVTNTALAPVIDGSVLLYDGQAFVPGGREEEEVPTSGFTEAEVSTPTEVNQDEGDEGFAFEPRLDDFEVVLGEDFELEQSLLYEFTLEGELILEGTATELRNIRPEGLIRVERGDITFLETEFFLVGRHENIVVFEPERGLFNPYIDVQFSTLVPEPDPTLAARDFSLEREVRDDLFLGSRSDAIEITLSIDGLASQIVPSLARDASEVCLNVTEPFPIQEVTYTQEQLNQLETCIQLAAFQKDESDILLLNSPAVRLSSIPPRDDGQIVSLLAGQFLELARQLQDSNEEELFQYGLTRFIVQPLLRDVIYTAEEAVSTVGREVGFDDLRVFPQLEVVYQVEEQSYVTVSYDYFINEVTVQYATQFD